MNGNSKYDITEELGSGAFGYVFLAVNKMNNQKVAIKRVEKVGKKLSREYEVLKALGNSKHSVKMLDCFYTKNAKEQLIQNMVFEHMDIDLETLIQRNKKSQKSLKFEQIQLIAYQILHT